MDSFLTVAKVLLLVISFLGYYRFLRFKFDIKQEFCPAVILSFIGCVLFVSGILHVLVLSANILLGAGVLLLGYSFVVNDNHSISKCIRNIGSDLTIGIVTFWLLVVFLVLRLRDAHIYDCDNFNHWGLIIKNLYYDSAFPDNSDPIIRFQSYTPGSTVVIWYFFRFFDYSDYLAILFQDIFMMSCGISFFAFVKKTTLGRTIAASSFALLGTLCSFSCDKDLFNGPFDLLVDQMLASVAVAAFFIIEYYKDDIKKSFYLLLPVLAFEVIVKNSGMLFVYLIAAILVYRIVKSCYSKRIKIAYSVVLMSVPLLIKTLWDIHVKLAFKDGSTSIHSASVENYRQILASKSPEDIKTITNLYVEKAFSTTNFIVNFLVVIFVLFIAFEYKKNNGQLYSTKKNLVYIVSSYVLYQIGLYCMYIFSMPVYEALVLPCYYRYIMTIDQFVFGIIVMMIIKICMTDKSLGIKSRESLIKVGAIVLSTVVLLIYSVNNFIPLFIPREKSNYIVITDYMTERFSEYDLPIDQNKSYLIYISGVDDNEEYSEFTDYKCHAATYLLYSANVHTLRLSQLRDFDVNDINDYDYFIVLFEDDSIKEYMADNGMEYVDFIEVNS